MFRIYICDDDPQWLISAGKMLESYLQENGLPAEIRSCSSGSGLIGMLEEEGQRPDVVFMDIEFEDGGAEAGDEPAKPNAKAAAVPAGIAAAAEINRRYPGCQVVFLSNYLSYALDVYQTEHVWYLLKEQFAERIPEVFGKILSNRESMNSELVIKDLDGRISKIRSESIIYIERIGRKTVLAADSGNYELKDRLPDILDKLPQDRFARCHNSYVVNLDRVREIHFADLVTDSGVRVLISRSYNKTFRKAYMDYVSSRMVR